MIFVRRACRDGDVERMLRAADSLSKNTIEGAFSVFKRGMKGVYQHCGKQHLHRYLAEFDFRYNNCVKLGVNDAERDAALDQIAKAKKAQAEATSACVHVRAGQRRCSFPG